MSPRIGVASLFLLLIATAPAFADAKPAAPTKEQIAKWIKQLGDADFAVRETASEEIWNATDDDSAPLIESALKEASKSDDAEIARRASEILERLQHGINAKTPKKFVALVERACGADQGGRQEAIKGLFNSGAIGLKILLKLIESESDPAAKDALVQLASNEALAAVPARIADGDRASTEALLDLSLHTNQLAANLSYVAYWLRHGNLAERIRIQQAIKPSNSESHAALLATLYRVHGDYPKARAAAEKSKNEELLKQVFFDQGDWKELASLAAKASDPDEVGHLGLAARLQRLAGDVKAADETLTRIRIRETIARVKQADAVPVLLLNERLQDALPLMTYGDRQLDRVELLCARYQFKEALDLIDKLKPDMHFPRVVEVTRGRTLYLIGDQERATNLFKTLGEQVKDVDPNTNSTAGFGFLIETEFKVGLKELACQHCAAASQRFRSELRPLFLDGVFTNNGGTAAVWWQYLRNKHPKDEPTQTMKRLREIMEGRVAIREFTPLAEDAMRLAGDLPEEQREQWFLALADSCQDAGVDSLPLSCLQKAVASAEIVAHAPKDARAIKLVRPPAAIMQLAGYYADKKDWTDAAGQYERAWANDRKEPLPAFLRGHALAKTGEQEAGKALMEIAHDIPLANAAARFRFIEELVKHGFEADARKECEPLSRINGFDDPRFTEEALRILAQYARAAKDYVKAADYYERSLLCHMHGNSEYRQSIGNLTIPAAVHSSRAMAFLTADKLADAQREIQTCLDILPGDINLAILVVPELEKRGQKKEAADLFAQVLAIHENLCKDYPKSSWAHNNAAWLAVRCHRNLDEAFQHAKLAVELAPDNAGYLVTLAEAHFQKGDKEKAIEFAKKCLTMEPKSVHFQRQLKRIEAGDPSVDMPE